MKFLVEYQLILIKPILEATADIPGISIEFIPGGKENITTTIYKNRKQHCYNLRRQKPNILNLIGDIASQPMEKFILLQAKNI
ncbi:hypothetical protein PR048_014311 [Dryococelus australis]|uniref:Uncharacterized protein n=1 Tax=Dryococelus australis TaxID=614101 RepID=A0ABQ9HE02_9NEOP|nr:hypothetical protein PR048_014311 [Dryococelus australis]